MPLFKNEEPIPIEFKNNERKGISKSKKKKN